MTSLTYVDIKCFFAFASEIGALIYISKKLILIISKKLENIVNIFVFFIKISYQSKESPSF